MVVLSAGTQPKQRSGMAALPRWFVGWFSSIANVRTTTPPPVVRVSAGPWFWLAWRMAWVGPPLARNL